MDSGVVRDFLANGMLHATDSLAQPIVSWSMPPSTHLPAGYLTTGLTPASRPNNLDWWGLIGTFTADRRSWAAEGPLDIVKCRVTVGFTGSGGQLMVVLHPTPDVPPLNILASSVPADDERWISGVGSLNFDNIVTVRGPTLRVSVYGRTSSVEPALEYLGVAEYGGGA